jgi:antitoxin HicB
MAFYHYIPGDNCQYRRITWGMAGKDSKAPSKISAIRTVRLHNNESIEKQNLSKAEMARRMRTSRAALERLLDPENSSVTLQTMNRAARSLGKRLRLTLV